jgi:hypothetical protein
MAHVQLATGVGQHGAGVKLLPAGVFTNPVNVVLGPQGLDGLFNLGMLVFVLHVASMKKPRANQRGTGRILGF